MILSDQEIKELVKQAKAGDKEAFGQIYDLFFEKIYKYIFFRTSNKEEAEDLASLVFLKVWQNLSKYKIKKAAKFSTWLFQIARFTLIDYYRQQKPKVSIEQIRELPANNSIINNIELNEVKRYILSLPGNYQTIIVLRYFEGLSFKEIAEIMGKTVIGSRVLLHRALKKLANLMGIKNE